LRLLVGAVLVEKSENIIGPCSGPEIAERMAVLGRVAIRGIDLEFVFLVRLFHRCSQGLARLEVIVIRGLEEENRYLCILDGTGHN